MVLTHNKQLVVCFLFNFDVLVVRSACNYVLVDLPEDANSSPRNETLIDFLHKKENSVETSTVTLILNKKPSVFISFKKKEFHST